jgi:hypothetical protein
MTRIIAALVLTSLLGLGSTFAQGSCASQAVSSTGKPLSGAARTSAIKKCCRQAAVSKEGKPLSGAAKASSVSKCMRELSSWGSCTYPR